MSLTQQLGSLCPGGWLLCCLQQHCHGLRCRASKTSLREEGQGARGYMSTHASMLTNTRIIQHTLRTH